MLAKSPWIFFFFFFYLPSPACARPLYGILFAICFKRPFALPFWLAFLSFFAALFQGSLVWVSPLLVEGFFFFSLPFYIEPHVSNRLSKSCCGLRLLFDLM